MHPSCTPQTRDKGEPSPIIKTVPSVTSNAPTIKMIRAIVGNFYGFTEQDFTQHHGKKGRRDCPLREARRVVAYLCWKYSGQSSAAIKRFVGYKDSAGIRMAHKRIELRRSESNFNAMLILLESQIKQKNPTRENEPCERSSASPAKPAVERPVLHYT